jgi:hypothetical protein
MGFRGKGWGGRRDNPVEIVLTGLTGPKWDWSVS